MQGINNSLGKIVPILSFVIPILLLYYLDPISFEHTWEGRTFYLFFIWLVILETILNWEKLKLSFGVKKFSKRIFLFLLVASTPTIYVIIFSGCGLDTIIAESAKQYVIKCNFDFFQKHNFAYFANVLPVPIEFLVFTILFCLVILLVYGIENLRFFSGSILFLGIIGILFLIEDLYPGGKFTPFQMLVPATAFFAARVLELFGYNTMISEGYDLIYGRLSVLIVNNHSFAIGWICAGVESLIIYVIVISLFLKKWNIPTKHKLLYFIIGVVITYCVNIMRIFTIVVIGVSGGDIWPFHNFYGQFYSITWITAYPLIIIEIEHLLEKRKLKRFN